MKLLKVAFFLVSFAIALAWCPLSSGSPKALTGSAVKAGPRTPPKLSPRPKPLPRPGSIRSTSGGDWESSGGTGVACFSSPEEAQRFDKSTTSGEPISDDIISSIDSLVTLEYWERKNENFSSGKDAAEILARLQRRLKLNAPIVSRQLEVVADRIHIGSWIASENLEPTQDAQPEKPIVTPETPDCRQIQLAVRMSQKTGVEQVPSLQVYFDSRLLAKLDALNRAMLELHERFYVLARQVGQANSRRTRMVVRRLFDENFWARTATTPGQLAMSVQNSMDFHLGNYIYIFSSLIPLTSEIALGSPQSRLMSLKSTIDKLSAALKVCVTLNGNEGPALQRCKSELFTSSSFTDQLNAEETFVYLYRWRFNPQFPHFLNNEITMIDWHDDIEMQALARQALGEACSLSTVLSLHPHGSGTAEKKAASYCAQVAPSQESR